MVFRSEGVLLRQLALYRAFPCQYEIHVVVTGFSLRNALVLIIPRMNNLMIQIN